MTFLSSSDRIPGSSTKQNKTQTLRHGADFWICLKKILSGITAHSATQSLLKCLSKKQIEQRFKACLDVSVGARLMNHVAKGINSCFYLDTHKSPARKPKGAKGRSTEKIPKEEAWSCIPTGKEPKHWAEVRKRPMKLHLNLFPELRRRLKHPEHTNGGCPYSPKAICNCRKPLYDHCMDIDVRLVVGSAGNSMG